MIDRTGFNQTFFSTLQTKPSLCIHMFHVHLMLYDIFGYASSNATWD